MRGNYTVDNISTHMVRFLSRTYCEQVRAIEVNSTKNKSCTDMSLVLEQMGL